MIPFAPNYLLESSICNYLTSASFSSGSLLSGSSYTCYTGIGNVDLINAPAVIVDASDYQEVVPFSRNYVFNTKIIVKEMAADTAVIGLLAGGIFNEFTDTHTACQNITNIPTYDIVVYQVQSGMVTPSESGDALVNTFECRMIGATV